MGPGGMDDQSITVSPYDGIERVTEFVNIEMAVEYISFESPTGGPPWFH